MAIDRTKAMIDGGDTVPVYNPIVGAEKFNVKTPAAPGKLPTTSVGGFRTIDYNAPKAAPNEKASLESRTAISRFVDNLKGNEQAFYQSVINTVGGLQNLTQSQADTLFSGMQKDMRDPNTNVGNRTKVTASGVNNWISANLQGAGARPDGAGSISETGDKTDTTTSAVTSATGTTTQDAYYKFLLDRAQLAETERQQTARASLEVLLRQFFFGSDASFVDDALRAAEGDIKLGLPTETIILKLQNYDDPNSLFARRFSGNVKLRKEGIEPLTPAEYLQQESRYREVLNTRGLGELSTRGTFADLIGAQVSPFELEDRVTKVFDVYDSADAALKTELQSTLNLDPLSTRTSVAKALLLGQKGATELQRQVRTAEVGVEAKTRGLDVSAAANLAGMGVTREQARAGFEQIALTQPRLTQLSEMYTRETPDTLGLQRELEAEQFQGMQSQRRRRLAEQETAAFMGQSGTASGISLGRRRTGQI